MITKEDLKVGTKLRRIDDDLELDGKTIKKYDVVTITEIEFENENNYDSVRIVFNNSIKYNLSLMAMKEYWEIYQQPEDAKCKYLEKDIEENTLHLDIDKLLKMKEELQKQQKIMSELQSSYDKQKNNIMARL